MERPKRGTSKQNRGIWAGHRSHMKNAPLNAHFGLPAHRPCTKRTGRHVQARQRSLEWAGWCVAGPAAPNPGSKRKSWWCGQMSRKPQIGQILVKSGAGRGKTSVNITRGTQKCIRAPSKRGQGSACTAPSPRKRPKNVALLQHSLCLCTRSPEHVRWGKCSQAYRGRIASTPGPRAESFPFPAKRPSRKPGSRPKTGACAALKAKTRKTHNGAPKAPPFSSPTSQLSNGTPRSTRKRLYLPLRGMRQLDFKQQEIGPPP